MSILTRIADSAHKVAVTGLFGTFCYGSYIIANQVIGDRNSNKVNGSGESTQEEHPQAGFINMLKTKAEEEYKNYYKIDHREWYDKDGKKTVVEYLCNE